MRYRQTGAGSHNLVTLQTKQLGSIRQISHLNYNDYRGRTDLPPHQQGYHNTEIDRVIQIQIDNTFNPTYNRLTELSRYIRTRSTQKTNLT